MVFFALLEMPQIINLCTVNHARKGLIIPLGEMIPYNLQSLNGAINQTILVDAHDKSILTRTVCMASHRVQ